MSGIVESSVYEVRSYEEASCENFECTGCGGKIIKKNKCVYCGCTYIEIKKLNYR